MRTVATLSLGLMALTSFASADDFTLKNPAGETLGPFAFQEGASIRLDDTTYRIASISNTVEQRLLKRLESIVIPEMDFKATPLEEVVDVLRKAAKKNDPSGEGVNIAFTSAPWGFATNRPPEGESNTVASVTLAARQVPLLDALKIIANICDFRCVLRQNTVLVLPLDAPTGPLFLRMYDVLPSFVHRAVEITPVFLQQVQSNATPAYANTYGDLKRVFADFGVPWPKGSSIQHIPAIGKMVVINTEDNLAVFEKVLSVINVIPAQIKMDFFFVAFPTGMVARSASGRHFTGDDALKLWKEGRGRAVASLQLMTKSATQATTKAVKEVLYPEEYVFAPSGNAITSLLAIASGAIRPGSFVTGEVGAVVNAVPEVTPDGQMIDFAATCRFTEEPAWEEYPAALAVSGGQATNMMCRKPVFPAHDIATSLSIYSGGTLVVGGGWPLVRTPEVMYVILRAELVAPDGKPIPPYDYKAILRDPL